MAKIKQTKYSSNDYWTDIIWHNESDLQSGNSLATATLLIQDQNPAQQQQIVVTENVRYWIKWTALYQDQTDFYYSANGLYTAPNDTSNYTVYQPDGTTTIDLSTSTIYPLDNGSGPDPLSRQTQMIFINYLFQAGQTYYLSFLPQISGPVGIYIYGD